MADLSFAWEPMLIAVIMMAFDMITGFAGAVKNKCIKSEKMRTGLWHKAGFCGIIVLAWMYEVGAQYLNFEVAKIDLGIAVPEIPAVTAVCCFIVATEIVSIIENLCELNEDIQKLPFLTAFIAHNGNEPDFTVDVEQPIDIRRLDGPVKGDEDDDKSTRNREGTD